MIVEFDGAREVRFGWLGGRVNNCRVWRVTGRDGRRPAGRKGEFNRIKESGVGRRGRSQDGFERVEGRDFSGRRPVEVETSFQNVRQEHARS